MAVKIKHYDTREAQEKSQNIITNGTTIITPDENKYLSKAIVTVNIPTYDVVKEASSLSTVSGDIALVVPTLLTTPTVSNTGNTSISITNIDEEATTVSVYANGIKIGSAPIE